MFLLFAQSSGISPEPDVTSAAALSPTQFEDHAKTRPRSMKKKSVGGGLHLSTANDAPITTGSDFRSASSLASDHTLSQAASAEAKKKQKRHVKFGSNTTHIVSSNRGEQHLWWTANELALAQTESKFDDAEQEEVASYHQFYKESYLDFLNDTVDAYALERLAQGLQQGYQGLERYSAFEHYRNYHRRSIVLSVLNAYRSEKSKELRHDRAHAVATSLTTKMAQWAAYLGEAGRVAASGGSFLYDRVEI